MDKSFVVRSTQDLVQIAEAGGGFTLTATMRSTVDLIKIAAAAKASGAKVTFTGLVLRPTPDLIKIAKAGAGSVHFVGDST